MHDGWTKRQTDRQTDRQTPRQTDRQTDRQAGIHQSEILNLVHYVSSMYNIEVKIKYICYSDCRVYQQGDQGLLFM